MGTFLWQDMRYGLRALAWDLRFTVTMVLTLALGIGATTACYFPALRAARIDPMAPLRFE
jgi:ABC-type lipoprotein release transport system permease subunit